MTCGIGVKPSREISARTSIMGYYFLSALEAPAPMPLPSLVRPTPNSESKYLSERIMRKSDCVLGLRLLTLGVLTNLVSATRDLRSHSATKTVPLRLLTSLVSATVSTRTIEYTLRQVVRIGSGTVLSADTKRFNHARLGTILPVSGVSGSSEAKYAYA